MSVQSLYQQKRMSAADAVRVVRNGDTIVVPTAVGEPPALLTALSEQRRDFRDVKVSQILPLRKYGYFDPGDGRQCPPRRLLLQRRHPRRRAGRLDRLLPGLFLGDAGADRPRADSGRCGVCTWPRRWTSTATSRWRWRRLHHGGHREGAGRGARGQPERAFRQRRLPHAHLAGDGAGGERGSPVARSACRRSARCRKPSASTSPT
jgi:antitoxin (DNA-binding transcriptional repressor) of toxin-antitoxin stability system